MGEAHEHCFGPALGSKSAAADRYQLSSHFALTAPMLRTGAAENNRSATPIFLVQTPSFLVQYRDLEGRSRVAAHMREPSAMRVRFVRHVRFPLLCGPPPYSADHQTRPGEFITVRCVYDKSPSRPSSRPTPDALTPPIATSKRRSRYLLTQTMPESIRAASA